MSEEARGIAPIPCAKKFAVVIFHYDQVDCLITKIQSEDECDILTCIYYRSRRWCLDIKLRSPSETIRCEEVRSIFNFTAKSRASYWFFFHRRFIF